MTMLMVKVRRKKHDRGRISPGNKYIDGVEANTYNLYFYVLLVSFNEFAQINNS